MMSTAYSLVVAVTPWLSTGRAYAADMLVTDKVVQLRFFTFSIERFCLLLAILISVRLQPCMT